MCFENNSKVEKIYSLDSIPSPSPSVKIQIIGGKVYMQKMKRPLFFSPIKPKKSAIYIS